MRYWHLPEQKVHIKHAAQTDGSGKKWSDLLFDKHPLPFHMGKIMPVINMVSHSKQSLVLVGFGHLGGVCSCDGISRCKV